MRYRVVFVCMILFRPIATLPQQPPNNTSQQGRASASPDLTNILDARINSEWQAIKNKDAKALGEILTDDYVGVEADMNGERYKWKALSELRESVVSDYNLSFLKVTPLCPDAAFARYEVVVRFPRKSSLVPFEKLLVGELWVKRDGAWKSMHYQETKVK